MTHPYASGAYARTLASSSFEPVAVPAWGTSVFRRRIGDGEAFDAMGAYPVAVIDGDADLVGGLDLLRQEGLVSVVLVADPVLRPSEAALQSAFDVVRPFKTHYMRRPCGGAVRYSKHHRYELSRATAEVRRIALSDHLDEWGRLYEGLIARHGIAGTAAFSAESFRLLCDVPGLVSFGAFLEGTLVGCHLWICDGVHAHSHLAAANAAGFASGASYRLYDAAIRFFRSAETIDLGGAAGLRDGGESGLGRFKRGFANHAEWAYLCGSVLDPAGYERLCAATGSGAESYFPAYRTPAAPGQGGMP